ncbi:MAG: phenylalanine--tRNA ligase subunit beta [Candidatus Woykebacteria bacterium RBG_16_44_10]|uniref:Phenylalanine--tRNA ligase beta subunit n=1 Tax=Candidatus Woykebacteria bacterium RBG_16_44_10 TaxID=1802597 RepID=A0A1G1WFA0_9BACT|nr:MAG: phenylalanine--tRNA ligase subunit beta [Candidatus Woykebacteria bacterium RBG_16_44_10]
MRVPLSWLKDYVEIHEEPTKLAEQLQYAGTKVESVDKVDSDTVFDLEITPNRPDCLSVIGIAREIAAIHNRRLSLPSGLSNFSVGSPSLPVNFVVSEKSLCPAYSVGVIDSIKVDKSPDWLRNRLEKSGVRSINNIVDVTNYVMLETGQPMHAFDFDKVRGTMRVRAAKKDERLVSLDGVERILPDGAIVIEDEEKLIDLAGLMGGESSEVDKNTIRILLHVPLYDPLAIRCASQYLGLRTQASNIFEKKLNPNANRYAFERAAGLISEVAQGNLVSSIKTVGEPTKERYIDVPISLITDTLGVSLEAGEVEAILGRLEFSTSVQRKDAAIFIKIGIPLFRTDITDPIDITEEVGRIYGYNKLPKKLPIGMPSAESLPVQDFEKKVREVLVSLNLKEIYSSSLTSTSVLEDLDIPSQNILRVANRLVLDYEYLRPTLLTGLVTAAANNIDNFDRFSLFEIGCVFAKDLDKDRLPKQPKKIAAIFVTSNFSFAKGVVEELFRRLNITSLRFEKAPDQPPFVNPLARVLVNNSDIGLVGKIEEESLSKFGVTFPTFAFELDLETMEKGRSSLIYKPTPKYPLVKEDISLFVPKNLSFSEVEKSIKGGAGKNFYSLELVEETTVSGKHSLLLRVKYFDTNKTLNSVEVERIREKVTEGLNNIGAELRDS